MCCSVLPCVAVCCHVLQCVAECCSGLQCVVIRVGHLSVDSCCVVLQCVAVCCSVLQCAVAYYVRLLVGHFSDYSRPKSHDSSKCVLL